MTFYIDFKFTAQGELINSVPQEGDKTPFLSMLLTKRMQACQPTRVTVTAVEPLEAVGE
jgi:hypothetical protein